MTRVSENSFLLAQIWRHFFLDKFNTSVTFVIENYCYMVSSVQVGCSVVSDYLRPHWLQHARPSCSTPLLEFTQTYVHWVSDAIQPSHPLSPLSSFQCPYIWNRVITVSPVLDLWKIMGKGSCTYNNYAKTRFCCC